MILTFANIITLLRILILPFFIFFLIQKDFPASLFLFLLAIFTDWLDGYYARKKDEITVLGRMLDPIADKLFLDISYFILLFKSFPFLVLVILIKDTLIVGGWIFYHYITGSIKVIPNTIGKTTAGLEMSGIILLLLDYNSIWPNFLWHILQMPVFILLILCSFLSLVAYYIRGIKEIKGLKLKNVSS